MAADDVKARQKAEYERRLADKDKAQTAKKSGLDFEKRHTVIRFGETYEGISFEENEMYQFLHQRPDGLISRGWVPVNFVSSILVADPPSSLCPYGKGHWGLSFSLAMGR